MPGVTTGLRGKERRWALRAHRLDMYCRAYAAYLEGRGTLQHLHERLNKLVECGVVEADNTHPGRN